MSLSTSARTANGTNTSALAPAMGNPLRGPSSSADYRPAPRLARRTSRSLPRLPGCQQPCIASGTRYDGPSLTLNGQQRRRCRLPEIRLDRLVQIRKHRPTLFRTTGDHRPNALAPVPAALPARPLRDAPVDHHEPDRLLRQVDTSSVLIERRTPSLKP